MERDTRTFRLRPHRSDGYSSPCRRVKKSALVRTITTSCSAGLLRRNVTKGTCCQAAPPETRSEEQNGFRAAGFAKVNARAIFPQSLLVAGTWSEWAGTCSDARTNGAIPGGRGPWQRPLAKMRLKLAGRREPGRLLVVGQC